MSRNKITSLRVSVNRIYSTALNIFPERISKPRLQKHKNHSKTSSGAGRFSQNLRACKKSQYNERNCKSGRHNRRHTFIHHKSRHRTTSTNIPYTSLKVKGRNKGKTKTSFPRRRNRMICAINLCQDGNLC